MPSAPWRLHYLYAPFEADVMHWFCKPSLERRTHHLHLVPYESRTWHEELAFRDHLRSNPEAAREYEGLKRDLARRLRHDRRAYTDAKAEFVERIVLRELGPA